MCNFISYINPHFSKNFLFYKLNNYFCKLEQILNFKDSFSFFTHLSRVVNYHIWIVLKYRLIIAKNNWLTADISSTAVVSSRGYYLVFPLENNWWPDRDAARIASYRPIAGAMSFSFSFFCLVFILLGSINTGTNRMYIHRLPSPMCCGFFVEL